MAAHTLYSLRVCLPRPRPRLLPFGLSHRTPPASFTRGCVVSARVFSRALASGLKTNHERQRSLSSLSIPNVTLARLRFGIGPPLVPHMHMGKKTKSFISMEDLHQGPILDDATSVPGVERDYDVDDVGELLPAEQRAALDQVQSEDIPVSTEAGAKRRRRRRKEDVAQGENDTATVSRYPTVIQQARDNMNKFTNCVVLTRVGGFYEIYFEQADEYAPLLGIKIATKRTSGGPVSMVLVKHAFSFLFRADTISTSHGRTAAF